MSQRVLVTAGAGGIGREIVRSFAQAGATVFVCDVDEASMAALAQEVPGALTRVCDMSKPADIEWMVTAATQALGRLENQTLTHAMFVSLFPNWTGQTQPRVVKLQGDTLRLSTEAPIQSNGKTVMSYLEWHRAGRE